MVQTADDKCTPREPCWDTLRTADPPSQHAAATSQATWVNHVDKTKHQALQYNTLVKTAWLLRYGRCAFGVTFL